MTSTARGSKAVLQFTEAELLMYLVFLRKGQQILVHTIISKCYKIIVPFAESLWGGKGERALELLRFSVPLIAACQTDDGPD